MTIDEAKRVRIVDFLAQLGHRAQYMKSEQYWYLSPLRKDPEMQGAVYSCSGQNQLKTA